MNSTFSLSIMIDKCPPAARESAEHSIEVAGHEDPRVAALRIHALIGDLLATQPEVGEEIVAKLRQLAAMLQADDSRAAGKSGVPRLTVRQRQILKMIAEGRSTREMALLLHISVKTVESHRAKLMEHLGIRDIAGLVVYAIRSGVIDIERGCRNTQSGNP